MASELYMTVEFYDTEVIQYGATHLKLYTR